MYFEELELIDFQIHGHRKFKFTPKGITIIQGDSHKGKSSIIRSLVLLITNKPTRIKGFPSFGKKDFKIILTTTNNVITRTKNKYILVNKKTNSQQIFESFGKGDPPTPITNALNMKPINIQRQLTEPHFLILDSGGQVAKRLEKAFGNEDKEKILKHVRTKISSMRSEYKILIQEEENCRQTINLLKGIKELKEKAERAKELEDRTIVLRKEIKGLEEIIESLIELQNVSNDEKSIKIVNKDLDRLGLEFQNYLEDTLYCRELLSIIDKLDCTDTIDENLLKEAYAISENALDLVNNRDRLSIDISQLHKVIQNIESIPNYSGKIKELEQEKISLFKKLGYCPLCKRKY